MNTTPSPAIESDVIEDPPPAFFPCSCGTEVLGIRKTCLGKHGSLIDLSIYYNVSAVKLTLWNRIKYAARVIFTGLIYEDQIVLSQETAQELTDKLLEFVSPSKQ